MSEGSYYIQQEEASERSTNRTGLGRVGYCILLLGLGAVVYGSSWATSHDKAASAVNLPAKLMKTGVQVQVPPIMPRGAAFLRTSVKPGRHDSSPKLQQPTRRGATAGTPAVPRAHAQEANFHYGNDVDVDYKEIPASNLQELLDQGWVLLDVRDPMQIARARVEGAVEVPLYIPKEDYSPHGLYQEAVNFGLGGWWAGTRPMKENADFVPQVVQKVIAPFPDEKLFPGIVVGCQTGLRSKQAIKELAAAGIRPRLAMIKGGFERVKSGELCNQDECILPHGARIQLAGQGSIAGMIGWH